MRCFQTLVRWSRIPRYVLAVAVILCLARSAIADLKKVGKIVIDKREVSDDDGKRGPGAKLTVHWELDKSFAKQSVFTKDNLRWLQRLAVSDKVEGVTPQPNRAFIDPRMDQPVSGHPNGKGDDLPFYDLSFPTLNDANNNTDNKIEGNGPYLRDDPSALRLQKNVSFEFTTFVVGIQNEKRLTTLGGFTWGFDVDKDGKNTLRKFVPIKPVDIGQNQFSQLSETLGIDFNGWGMRAQNKYSDKTQYYLDLQIVPEPGTLSLLVFAALAVASHARRRS